MYLFRHFWYEIFLLGHILLAIIFLIGCWYHVLLLQSGHMEWLYAAIALWSFDRLIRLARIILLNISWSGGRLARTGKFEIVQGTNAIKTHINVGYNFTFRPGQYIYVYFPRFNFWESHPFTIAEHELVDGHQPRITLLFRAHGGVTRKLLKHLAEGPKEMVCLLEGPYGHFRPVDKYDNVLLLAGGVGITAVFPYLRHLATVGVNRVRFIWIVRDENSITWFAKLLSSLLASENVDLEIHITKSESPRGDSIHQVPEEKHISLVRDRSSLDLGVGSATIGAAKLANNGTVTDKEVEIPGDKIKVSSQLASRVFVGSKPCLTELVKGQVGLGGGSLAVLACGPGTFVDDIRRAVGENVTLARGVVDYFEESFTW